MPYAVCVIRDARLTDEDQIRFARAFGPLELVPPGRKRIPPKLYDISNLMDKGVIIPPKPDGPSQQIFEQFYTDGPFNKWSLLQAYVTPPKGANTDYVGMREVCADLFPEMKAKVDRLNVDHDLFPAMQRNGVDSKMRK